MKPGRATSRIGTIDPMLRSSLALALVLVAACSSSDDTTPNTGGSSGTTAPPPDGLVGDVRESVTWEDGTKLAGVVRIVEGTTVTIAPGAKITCNEATQILLGGTLKVSAKDKHAKISCAKWTGITVASNGKLDIDGLDIENAAVGYQTTANAGDSVIKNSKITTCVRPFVVGEKSKLTLDHVEASVPTTVGAFDKSYVEVFGTLEAHYLTYEAQGNEGIMTREGGSTTMLLNVQYLPLCENGSFDVHALSMTSIDSSNFSRASSIGRLKPTNSL